jgi:hypothetical protein
MGRYAVGPGVRGRGACLAGVTALALAGLAPVWMAGPGSVAAATHPTGGVVAWGDNSAGQTSVPQDATSDVISVAAGCAHSLALRSDGRVVAWGDNSHGQTNVPAAAKSRVVAIVAGCNHNIAIKSNGTLVAWGDNSYGQTNVPSLPGGWKWTSIAAGESHSVGIARSSNAVDVYIWGDDSYGQAQVTPSDSDSHGYVNWHDVKDVEAGGYATMARMGDGSVMVWGEEQVVAMATSWASVRDVPAGLGGVVGMSMGQFHALALKSNGTVVAWGANNSGQAKVPAGLSKVKAVAAGGAHSLALLSSGQIVTWGADDMGQTSGPPPRGDSRYIWVAAGLKHSLAVGQLAPDAPTGVTATPWDGAITVSWTAPDDPGSAPISGYTVTAAPGGMTCVALRVPSCTIGGLANGTMYTFSVTARNSIGDGAAATSLPTAPAVPTPVIPETTASPSPSPSPSPAVAQGAGSDGEGGAGGLPLPILVAVALAVGLAAAAIAYEPSLIVRRGRDLAPALGVRVASKLSGPRARPNRHSTEAGLTEAGFPEAGPAGTDPKPGSLKR